MEYNKKRIKSSKPIKYRVYNTFSKKKEDDSEGEEETNKTFRKEEEKFNSFKEHFLDYSIEEKDDYQIDLEETEDILRCRICLKIPKNPKMCNKCCKIGCEKCFKNWFKKKNNCPICTNEITLEELINVPFISNISNLFHCILKNNNIKNINQKNIEYCENHKKEEIDYFCLDCNKKLCRECISFYTNKEEFDIHIKHRIVKYNIYKTIDYKNDLEKLDILNEENKDLINIFNSYLFIYDEEKKIINEFIENLKQYYNSLLDKQIIQIKKYIENLENYCSLIYKKKSDIQSYFKNLECEKINELTDYNKIKKIKNSCISYKDVFKLMEYSLYFQNIYTFDTKILKFSLEDLVNENERKILITQINEKIEFILSTKINSDNKKYLNIVFYSHKNIKVAKGFIYFQKNLNEVKIIDLKQKPKNVNSYNYFYFENEWDNFIDNLKELRIKGVLYCIY